MNTTKTRIADLKVGDIVHAHGGVFEVKEHPFDSISHSDWKDSDGWCVGPAGVAVARAECLEGEISGYFKPGSEWTFQGTTAVTVHRVGGSMSTSQQLIDHLANLERSRDEAFAEGNWERVDLLGNCIDDTRAAIAKATGQ